MQGGVAAGKGAVAPCKALRACKAASQRVKSHRDEIGVASQFIGWFKRSQLDAGVP